MNIFSGVLAVMLFLGPPVTDLWHSGQFQDVSFNDANRSDTAPPVTSDPRNLPDGVLAYHFLSNRQVLDGPLVKIRDHFHSLHQQGKPVRLSLKYYSRHPDGSLVKIMIGSLDELEALLSTLRLQQDVVWSAITTRGFRTLEAAYWVVASGTCDTAGIRPGLLRIRQNGNLITASQGGPGIDGMAVGDGLTIVFTGPETPPLHGRFTGGGIILDDRIGRCAFRLTPLRPPGS